MKSCSKCGAPATCVITQTINGKQTKEYLCSNCAGTSQLCAFFFGGGVSDRLHFSDSVGEVRCDLCGSRFGDILQSGKVGCPRCYSCFGERMKGLIRQIHGDAVYKKETENAFPTVVSSPSADETVPTEELLLRQMKEAIAREDYESAAMLRDQLNAMKGEKQNGNESN